MKKPAKKTSDTKPKNRATLSIDKKPPEDSPTIPAIPNNSQNYITSPLRKPNYEKYCILRANDTVRTTAYSTVYGCKEHSARRLSFYLEKKPEIQARIQYLYSQRIIVQSMSKEQWLANMAKFATDTTKTEVSRLKAYEMYGKAQGFYSDNQQTQVNIVSDNAIRVLKDRLDNAKKLEEGRKYVVADVSEVTSIPPQKLEIPPSSMPIPPDKSEI